MIPDLNKLRSHLQNFDIQGLLIDGLGWDYYDSKDVRFPAEELKEYSLKPVSEKDGFVVYVCVSERLPPHAVRKRLSHLASKLTFEHLIVFMDKKQSGQIWQWRGRKDGRPIYRQLEYDSSHRGDALLDRIRHVAYKIDDVPGIVTVSEEVGKAFDVEKVTRKFYDHFKLELIEFQKFIDGISAQFDRELYASLMLNRMMFVYFFQKKGFLDGDFDYLHNRLRRVRKQNGKNRFYSFYREFLLRFFHDGLGKPEKSRSRELIKLLGRIPYLNGDLFDVHKLEAKYENICIKDEAFERIFSFFDKYTWHLDWRPEKEDNEIHPDVLGYIFEKYINQKQMGAYYTKEDIANYISASTIIPAVLDAAKERCPDHFDEIWTLLKDSPNSYLHSAVRHGISVQNEFDVADELPPDIAAGIADASQRDNWNNPASSDCALSGETWREVIERRQYYGAIRAKLASKDAFEIDELVTLNLNVQEFAQDVMARCREPRLLRAFWQAIRKITILDPTCGSGAFLFAALDVLEPLYDACLKRMEKFLDGSPTARHDSEALKDFAAILHDVERHPGQIYYILKSIVINNLYGVDIMEEAVEICKLRLFLKLVSQLETFDQIEPLPNIGFNIVAGNTLVGFTSMSAVYDAMQSAKGVARGQRSIFQADKTKQAIQKKAKQFDAAYNKFRDKQTKLDGAATAHDKTDLLEKRNELRDELNHYLAIDYNVIATIENTEKYSKWLITHQPFHWITEFYGIMNTGGFDVIIGNPPYVEYRKVKNTYTVQRYDTLSCNNLFAYVIERNAALAGKAGRTGMIVPLSAICTDRMAPVQKILSSNNLWVSSYAKRPSKLFYGVEHRLCIYVSAMGDKTFSTRYHRWNRYFRSHLFQNIRYAEATETPIPNSIPKFSSQVGKNLLKKLLSDAKLKPFPNSTNNRLYYHNSPEYWARATDFAPYFWNERDGKKLSSHVKILNFKTHESAQTAIAILNSSLFYWWYLLFSDCRDLNLREITNFPVGLETLPKNIKKQLTKLNQELMENLRHNAIRKETWHVSTGKVCFDEFNQKPSKPIVDKIDRVLAKHYGMTDEELDYIINYDYKYRMSP